MTANTELVRRATDLVATNTSMSMTDLLKALAPAPVSEPSPAKVPAPRKITEKQRAAIERMPEVYGQVVPSERRALTSNEVRSLLDERVTLDEVKKAATARLEDITLIAHNHLDVEVEEEERPTLGPIVIGVNAGSNQIPTKASVSAVSSNAVVAPLAGSVARILVAEGDEIEAGQVLLILEAMKMETEITAPTAGTVSRILVAPGEAVQGGQALIEF